jgi:hypothetical protein
MKTLLLLLIPFLGISQTQNTTNIGRCLASTHYTKLTNGTEKEIDKVCSVCFTDDVFAIYVPELGTISFMIDPATLTNKPTENGMEENFMNAEDATTREGEYIVDITYSNPKVILFEEPRYGLAIEIKATNWLGSTENSGIGKVAFSAMKKEKNKKPDINPNYALNPQLRQSAFITDTNLTEYINRNLGLNLKDTANKSSILVSLTISYDGKVTVNKGSTVSYPPTSRDIIYDKIANILNEMPNWHFRSETIKKRWFKGQIDQFNVKVNLYGVYISDY